MNPPPRDLDRSSQRAVETLAWIRGLRPFWPSVHLGDSSFYREKGTTAEGKRGLLISGPSRNGNHLLHSLLDGHSRLPRIPGEDAVLNCLFERLLDDFERTDARLQSAAAASFLSGLSGKGTEDKWAKIAGYTRGGTPPDGDSSVVWSGMYYGRGRKNFVYDYQDTEVGIDHPSYARFLETSLRGSDRPGCLHDLMVVYFRALARLDPGFPRRNSALGLYDGIAFGSGSRGPLDYMFAHGDYLLCVAPIRPFETYYYSFAKGFFDTQDVHPEILQEAWEHWFHKVTDYLIIKRRYPERLCLVNFVHLIAETERTMQKVCEFLGIPFEGVCLRPSVLGQPTKGNSSYPKSERDRGQVYDAPMQKCLPEAFCPPEYPAYWRAVESLSV